MLTMKQVTQYISDEQGERYQSPKLWECPCNIKPKYFKDVNSTIESEGKLLCTPGVL